jgi:hypothetical protein
MTFPVSYYCPHCGAICELEREGYLADRSVTPYPLVGWQYAAPDEPFEDGAAEGVRLTCGERSAAGLTWTGERSGADDVEEPGSASPCGRDFYLSFVKFEAGREVEPDPDSDYVRVGF